MLSIIIMLMPFCNYCKPLIAFVYTGIAGAIT